MSNEQMTLFEDDAGVLDAEYDDEEMTAVQEAHIAEKAAAEGLLFITGDEGLTLKQIAQALEIKEKEAEAIMDELTKDYSDEHHGIEVARFGDVYRFLSKAKVHTYAAKLFAQDKTNKLSSAALETLAIIAYKQPITRVEIEEIRGVGADVMLRKLMARGLIKEDGRSDAPGRPILYSVTDDFMDAFQLVSLKELPELPQFNDDEENDLFSR